MLVCLIILVCYEGAPDPSNVRPSVDGFFGCMLATWYTNIILEEAEPIRLSVTLMVPEAGIEPARSCPRGILRAEPAISLTH